ncbi:TIGR02450 family Trp-rich protein [Nitrincola alkalilacustris]|uniref:TIGR02450 family Trp-rich protein n=1 Tax=Nitrincola alkalilacustris TaxID=1571224 RepID=UPI00124EB998|nr:TIGR02450 family Trp-rich protein [Nitrincola alkalilacustris]
MRPINPNKLLHSKWTAVTPRNREKHFLVIDLVRNEHETVVECIIEAVMSKRAVTLPWRELKNVEVWHQGWH